MDTTPPWQSFADRLLAREALRFRADRGEPPRDFAGLIIADPEIDHLVAELPGLRIEGPGLSEELDTALNAQVRDVRAGFHSWLEAPDDLFGATVWSLSLDADEAEVFAVIAATELDPARQSLVAYLNDNVALKRPTLGLLRRIFPPPHAGPVAVGPDAALARGEVVSVDVDAPWASLSVKLPISVGWMLAGDRSLDEDLPVGTTIRLSDGEGGSATLLMVSGGDATARRVAAFETAAASAFLISPLPSDEAGWRALVRQATVAGTGIVVDLAAHQALPGVGKRFIERTPHVPWVIASPHDLAIETFPAHDYEEIRVDDVLHRVVRGSHVLDLEQDRLVSLTPAGKTGDWDTAVRRLAGGHLDELAIRIRPRRTWNDLVLAPEQLSQALELVARYRHRPTVYDSWKFSKAPSSGITALFAGPSGTGKTLTAEVLAAELGLDLYRIDLSSVVSKYIGETEKNLERIFTAAATSNVVLFFDEADSLFGKRSEVSDAHDRYANIEVSYLLQRLEQHDGLVVLATNLSKNMDDAFVRRIDVAIEFQLPEPTQRRAIWERSFPKSAPVGEIDYEFLAQRFDVSGGNITNASLAAAFLAAEADHPIGMEDVVLGMKREFQKLGRLRTESEFARYLDLVNGEHRVTPA